MSRQTLIESLCASLENAGRHSAAEVPPVAVLWTDPKGEWLPLVETLRNHLPQLLIHGEYSLEKRTGPAIWLKCALARALPEVPIAPDLTPILYLPKISRQTLRAGTECPALLQPLVELLYRGTVWTQKNGRDWSVEAMLAGKDTPGLGLDVAKDERTKLSMMASLSVLADSPVSRLQGRRLEAEDFDKLMIGDHPRDLLRWMSDPDSVGQEFGKDDADGGPWHAFRSRCRDDFGFDPEADGDLVAGERLGMRETSAWDSLWDRFCQSPKAYPGVPDLLRRSKPTNRMAYEKETWPDENEAEENSLRDALLSLEEVSASDAREAIVKLEADHGVRRSWVWAALEQAPLALALKHLVELAGRSKSAIGGDSPEDLAKLYADGGYLVDDAAMAAMATVRTASDAKAVYAAVRALYLPWLDHAALRLQEVWGVNEASSFVRHVGTSQDGSSTDRVSERLPDAMTLATGQSATGVYSAKGNADSYLAGQTIPATHEIQADAGCCLLFADGLRFDLAQRLSLLLAERGLMVMSRRRWSALPSVTATAKPAVSPVKASIQGVGLPDSFAPCLVDAASSRVDVVDAASSRVDVVEGSEPGRLRYLTFSRMHSLLKDKGYQIVGSDDVGDPAAPAARGWCEFGEIDKRGHSMQAKLATVLGEQVELIAERVAELLNAGWREVRVVTDHGWLLMPGGLPKEDLPHYLTQAKWARCATIKGESKPNVPKATWFWNRGAEFAFGPGVRCFSANNAYAHGGISLQECLIPDMSITLQNQPIREHASIAKVDWKGLKCRITVQPALPGLRVDLRSKPNDSTTSIADGGKPLDGSETVTLFVEDEDQEGCVVAVIVCNDAGQTIAKQNTTVGGES